MPDILLSENYCQDINIIIYSSQFNKHNRFISFTITFLEYQLMDYFNRVITREIFKKREITIISIIMPLTHSYNYAYFLLNNVYIIIIQNGNIQRIFVYI